MLHSCYINNWQGQAFNVRRNRNLQKMLCLQIRIPYNFTFICSNFFCVRKCVTMHGVWKTVNTSYEIIPSAIPYHSTTWDPVSYLKFRLTLLLKGRWGQVHQFEIWHNRQLRKEEKHSTVTFDYWQNRLENEPFPTSPWHHSS